MTAETPHQEPSMDEILASIRKIIATDSHEEISSETHSFFNTDRSEDILDLTDALPEECGRVQAPITSPEFHVNDLGEWSPPTDNPHYHEEAIDTSHIRAPHQAAFASTTTPSTEDSLLSQETMSEAMQAFHLLNTLEQEKPKASKPRPQAGMGGQTLEDVMQEMLKPLLKEWLDAHLPSIVRSVVTQQVEKIVREKGRE